MKETSKSFEIVTSFANNIGERWHAFLPSFPAAPEFHGKKIRFGPEFAIRHLVTNLEIELQNDQLIIHAISIRPEDRGDKSKEVYIGSKIINILKVEAKKIGVKSIKACNVQLRAEEFWGHNGFPLAWEDGEWVGYYEVT